MTPEDTAALHQDYHMRAMIAAVSLSGYYAQVFANGLTAYYTPLNAPPPQIIQPPTFWPWVHP